MRLFGEDFDRQLLTLDNYIPLLTLLVRREHFLDVGGFDREFDLFEDWDFLLRLARRGSFLHVPKLTCEVRHFPTGDSIVQAATQDSARMRQGKMQIWARHADLVSHDALSDFVERRKRTAERLSSAAESAGGRAAHLALDVDRLIREKTLLLSELTAASEQIAAANDEKAALNHEKAALHHEKAALLEHSRQLEQLLRAAEAMLADVDRHRAELQHDQSEKSELLGRLFEEVERLTALLDQVHGSRTWKLHSLVERVRGRR